MKRIILILALSPFLASLIDTNIQPITPKVEAAPVQAVKKAPKALRKPIKPKLVQKTVKAKKPVKRHVVSVHAIVRQAALRHGLSPSRFANLISCESGFNARAVNYSYYENGYPSGLGQHLSGYYPARASKYGYSTDVFNAYSNANVTAAMIRDGHQRLWECQY